MKQVNEVQSSEYVLSLNDNSTYLHQVLSHSMYCLKALGDKFKTKYLERPPHSKYALLISFRYPIIMLIQPLMWPTPS